MLELLALPLSNQSQQQNSLETWKDKNQLDWYYIYKVRGKVLLCFSNLLFIIPLHGYLTPKVDIILKMA